MSAGTFHVMAEVVKGKHWVNVLTTADLAYAKATKEQYREAKVRVRIDAVCQRPTRRGKAK